MVPATETRFRRSATEKRERLLAFAPAVTVVTALIFVWFALGNEPSDVAGYAARLLFGVMMPGLAILRFARGRASGLFDDAAIGFSVGTIAQVPIWWISLVSGVPFWWWPTTVALAVLGVPRFRRVVFDRPPTQSTLPWRWATAGVCLLTLAWVTGDFLRWNPADPGSGHVYYPDMLYQLGLAAEATKQIPPTDPFVAGEPLYYHWLAHMDMAVGARAAGVELTVVLFQLWVPVVVLAGICTVAAVARRLSGHMWAGPLAALLVYGVGEISARSSAASQFQPMTFFYYWASPTQALASVLTVAAAYFFCCYLAGTIEPTRTFWLLGVPLLASLTLVKASALPLIIAGGVAALGWSLLQRDRTSLVRATAATAVAVGLLVIATTVLYGGDSQGLRFEKPFATLTRTTQQLVPAILDPRVSPWALAVAVALITVVWVVAVLGRLFGILLLLPRWRQATTSQVFLLGALLAGMGAYVNLTHPGGSNIYFAIGAFPLGAILSAWGFCAVTRPVGPRTATLLALSVAIFASLVFTTRGIIGGEDERGTRIREQLMWAARPYLVLFALVVIVFCALLAVRSSGRLRRLPISCVLGASIIALGLPMTFSYVASSPTTPSKTLAQYGDSSWAAVTNEGVRAARWLRDHSSPSDVIATNRHCAIKEVPDGSPSGQCRAMGFSVSAYTERRVLVEGWAFSLEARSRDVQAQTAPGVQPFWDAAKFLDNERFFNRPTPEAAAALCQRGVRWAFLDRRWDAEAPSLGHVADLRYRTTHAEVYELRC